MPKQPPLILSVLSLLVFQNWPGKGGGVIYALKEILRKVEKRYRPNKYLFGIFGGIFSEQKRLTSLNLSGTTGQVLDSHIKFLS